MICTAACLNLSPQLSLFLITGTVSLRIFSQSFLDSPSRGSSFIVT